MSMVALASRFNRNCSWIMFLPEIPQDTRYYSLVSKVTMFYQSCFHSSSKGIHTLAIESSRLSQVWVNMGGKVVH